MREFKLRGEGWKGEAEVVRGASFASGFDVMRLRRYVGSGLWRRL